MKNIKRLVGFLVLLVMTSCLNEYEKELVGEYKIKDYELINKEVVQSENLPKLILKNDRTFLIIDGKHMLIGDWEADDNKEWTYIDLFIKGTSVKVANGVISGDNNEKIINSFHCYSNEVLTNYKGISFIKPTNKK